MDRLTNIICVILLFGGCIAFANAAELSYQPGRVIIMTEPDIAPSLTSLLPNIPFSDLKNYNDFDLQPLRNEFPLAESADKSAPRSPLEDLYILSFPDTMIVTDIVNRILGQPGIKYVEPDYKVELYNWPTDSLFDQQWYLKNTGQGYYGIIRVDGYDNDTLYTAYGTAGEDINLGPIYDDVPADAVEVIVGVIDTGVDYLHPDIVNNIQFNSGEIPENDIDDDHNGLIDDYVGWDFSGNSSAIFGTGGDNDPMDDDIGHGTHVAGCVAAVNNSIGVASYPANLKILPIKIFPRAFQSVTVPAILYAVEMGAKVVNLSWGSPYEMDVLRETLAYARSRGCLPVAAAGNFGNSHPNAPAAFDETFTVGGTNSIGNVTYFSTYGPFIDIVAPARDILSLRANGTDMYEEVEPGLRIIDDLYILADGTSMASPIVAGAAAMLMSFHPGLDIDRVSDALRQTAVDLLDPWGDGLYLPGPDTISGWGRMNVAEAFNFVQAPSAFIDSPTYMETESAIVTVGVSTTGGYSGFARLYLGRGLNADDWTQVHEVSTLSDQSDFYTWNSDGENDYFSFRLETESGFNQVDFRVINETGAKITKPIQGDTLIYIEEVWGSAYGADYDSVVVCYRGLADVDRTRLFGSPALYFNELLIDWSTSRLDEGEYRLFIESYSGLELVQDSVQVFVKQTMRSGFPVQLPSYIGFSPGVADIDGDGLKEIVVGCQDGIYAYRHDGTLMPNFPIQTDKDMRSLPAFDDVDGDGLLDILMSGDSLLGCYNYLGQAVAGWPNGASTGMTYFTYPVTVASKLYNQSDSVAMYMSRLGEIHAYKYGGDPYFYSLGGLFTALDPNLFDTSNTTGLAAPFVTAVDLEPDGSTDVVAVYGSALDESGIYIWNGRNGLPPQGWETPQARNILRVTGGTLADVDNNGSLEIIAGGVDSNNVNHLYVTRNGREDLPGWPVALPAVSGWIGTSPICVDIDRNGFKEILIAYYNWDFGHIYAFNYDGTPYRDNPVYLDRGLIATIQNTLGHLIVADIDGNGELNIISRGGYLLPYATSYEKIFAWEPDGTLTEGFPIVTPTLPNKVFSTPHTPLIDDLDNDGRLELLLCGDWNELFVYNLDAPYDSDMMPWPKYMGDIRNSGINPDREIVTDVGDNETALPLVFEISDNYPNPFNPATTIRFSLDRSSEISLDVFNILGQKVLSVASGLYPAGEFTVEWKGVDARGDEVASGVYFARLTGNGNQSTRKMLLIR